MATRKAPPEVVEEQPVEDLGPAGVRSLEPEPEETEYLGVDEVPPEPRGDITTTENFYTVPGAATEVVEFEPEIVEGDEPTYRIRLTQSIEPIFIGIDYPIPAMHKDVLYEVSERVYQYLLPKGLIQGK
jgi:hypothetical protein